MKIEELKKEIETETLTDDLLIFICKDDNVIAKQYINAIAKFKNLTLKTVEEPPEEDIFDTEDSHLFIYHTDKVVSVQSRKNCVIICRGVDKSLIYDRVVEIPKLEEWQLKDYIKQSISGLSEKNLEKFISLTKNTDRIMTEVDRIKIFPKSLQNSLFEDCLRSGIYSDLSFGTVFELTNAIFSHDIKTICALYSNLDSIGVEPAALTSILYNNIRNMIMVSLQRSPTEENTGLKSNQIYAIRKSAQRYTRDDLLKMFHIMSLIDLKLKSGELPAEEIVDYIIVKLLNVAQ